MKPNTKPSGIILCGGQSKRMGQNKALMKLGGICLIEHVINALKPICCEIILSVNNDDLNFLPHKKVKDLVEGIGPIAGFYSALKNSNSPENIIVSCDMPFISSAFLQYLHQQLNNFDIVLPIYNSKIQTVTGIFSKKILPVLKNQMMLKNFVPVNIFEKCNTLFVNPERKKILKICNLNFSILIASKIILKPLKYIIQFRFAKENDKENIPRLVSWLIGMQLMISKAVNTFILRFLHRCYAKPH